MIVLVGCSGSGKSTISNCLVRDYGYRATISYTTRPMRSGEVDGVDYHFISEEEFLQKKKEGFFAESAMYREWYYGTAAEDCTDDKIAVLTPHGLRQMRKLPQLNIMSFYINVPRKDRIIKTLERGDDIEEIKRRDSSDIGQFDGIEDEVDRIIYNAGYKNTPEFLAKSINFTYTAKKKLDRGKKLTILCDIDCVVNNLVEEVLKKYNEKYNDNLLYEDITDYCMDKFTKPECENVFKEFCNNELISNMKVQDGAVEVVTKLIEEHDFYFVSCTYPENVYCKSLWLKAHFPNYDEKRLIICHNKSLVHGDILIDDCIANLNSSVKLNLLYDQPWNQTIDNCENIIRVSNWKDIVEQISIFSKKEIDL